jgi:hypothetical protein
MEVQSACDLVTESVRFARWWRGLRGHGKHTQQSGSTSESVHTTLVETTPIVRSGSYRIVVALCKYLDCTRSGKSVFSESLPSVTLEFYGRIEGFRRFTGAAHEPKRMTPR